MLEYIRENNIAQYKGIPGVWILLGKEKADTHFVCLQVGQTKDIGNEIKTNISYLGKQNFEPTTKKYVNQFGEFMFSYEEHIDERRKMLYGDIAKKYVDLTFVCITSGEELKNQVELLKAIEKYVAYKTSCRYWVNGGPYRDGKASEKIEEIKNDCTNKCGELFETIKKDYPGKADPLKKLEEFLAQLID